MKKPTIKVIYNHSCSICRFEINHYKKQNIDTIQYLDLHQDLPEKLRSIDKAKLVRKLHVYEGDKVYIGVDAFKLIWSKIDRYKLLAKLLDHKVVYFLATYLYEVLAFFLYLKNRKQINE
ncbi:MAG: DCC1-like thiol-disulfide oxidoreductase family protein [Pseudomonadota bacterium]|nr:DCC1-like thiol-disulfide oxidoreductase family protein [Pseudomonadota bacterium]